MSAAELLHAGAGGLALAVDAVGWVLVPQIALAIAILSLALQQLAGRLAGDPAVAATPPWLDPPSSRRCCSACWARSAAW